MPKRNHIEVQLAPEQYDRCADCPLIGLIPENERKEGKRKKYVCLGVPLQALTSKGIWVRASRRDKKHPLHRPCDSRWSGWMTLRNRTFCLSNQYYIKYRLPFEQNIQMKINFD